MGTINSLEQITGESIKTTCSICGENKADAYWRGDQEIYVCYECALSTFPRLMADAIAQRFKHSTLGQAFSDLKAVEKEYWCGIACAISKLNQGEN